QLDFPRLIMRAKSVNAREDAVKLRERILAHPPLAADSIRRHEGSIEITTRPDPGTGSTHRLFDPLDWIHAVTAHIPDRGRHCVRYYGALANRGQSPKAFCEQQTPPAPDPAASGETTSEFVQRRRASWARLIRRILEVDPLLCRCGAEMKIISFITDPRVVDRILRHRESQECRARDPFEPRAPPQPGGNSLQRFLPSRPLELRRISHPGSNGL